MSESDTPANVDDGDREVAEANEIIRVTVGSGLHGMAIEGHDDNDEMGVYIQTPEQLLGLEKTAEHWNYRTQPAGARSGPGDTDLVVYSLRKYLRLATQGNPSILTLLFAPKDKHLRLSPWGQDLLDLAPDIISARAGWRHLGYLDGQRERMVGGGKQNRVPNRPELIEAHGYDTKYASHALRLGLQGIELLETGRLDLPMTDWNLRYCMEVKRGEVGFDEALRRVDLVRKDLARRLENGEHSLPPEPDMHCINAWMVSTTRDYWDVKRK